MAAALARAFADGENEPGRTRVVVLSHRVWTQRFGADPRVVGQTVQFQLRDAQAADDDLKQLVAQLTKPRNVWVMLPAGEPTETEPGLALDAAITSANVL